MLLRGIFSKKKKDSAQPDISEAYENQRNAKDKSALHIAVAHGNALLVQSLVKDKALDVNSKDFHDYTPLHLAFSQEKLSQPIIDALMAHPAVNVNLTSLKGVTPLHFAMSNERIEQLDRATFNRLFYLGDVTLKTNTNVSVLHLAANNKNLSAYTFNSLIDVIATKIPDAKQFEDFLNNVDESGNSALVYAAKNGKTEVISALKNWGAYFAGAQGELALKSALLNNHAESAIKLIEYGANPDVHLYPEERQSKLSTSSYISGVLSDGVDKTKIIKPGDTPLHFAVKTENLALAVACLNAKPEMVNSINDKSKSAAFTAVKVLSQPLAHQLWLSTKDNAHIKQSFEVSKHRSTTLLMEMARRDFVSKEDLQAFFTDENYKLSPQQEETRKRVAEKYQTHIPRTVSFAKTMSVMSVVKAPESEEEAKSVSVSAGPAMR